MESKGIVRVAIAEDQAIYRQGLENLLNSFAGVNVVCSVENGQELINTLQHERIDVVFLDYRMPVLNGLETVRRIRKFDKKLKILIISMYDDNVFVEQTIESGANGYLSKDDSPEEIERAVFSCMETGYYLSDRTSKMLISKLMVNGKIKPQLETRQVEFTPFELQVLQMICKEFTTQEIADVTFKAKRTIEGARTMMLQKVGARNVVGLVMYAVKHNLISEDVAE